MIPAELEITIGTGAAKETSLEAREEPAEAIVTATNREYQVRMRFRHAAARPGDRRGSEVVILPEPLRVRLDSTQLPPPGRDAAAYGKALYAQLFAPLQLQEAFSSALNRADASGSPLRIRLHIERPAAELHRLLWETLWDPRSELPLTMGEKVVFSRYVASDWAAPEVVARSYRRALVVISSPDGVEPVNVTEERERLSELLTDLNPDFLTSGRATRQELGNALNSGYDLIYVIGHATTDEDGRTTLILEKAPEAGGAAPAPGDGRHQVEPNRRTILPDPVTEEEFLNLIRPLIRRPRVMLFTGCQTAGSRGTLLRALGPSLAALGIPAVVAMQGTVLQDTAGSFIADFLGALLANPDRSSLDRSVARARRAAFIGNRTDYWMPVLFMRTEDGEIRWNDPDFRGGTSSPRLVWGGVRASIVDQTCTPVLGSEFLETLIGPWSQVIEHLVEEHGYPLDPHGTEDLPHVAQCLENSPLGRAGLFHALATTAGKRLRGRFGKRIDEMLREQAATLSRDEFNARYGDFLERALTARRAGEPVSDNLLASHAEEVPNCLWCKDDADPKGSSDSRFHSQLRAAAEIARENPKDPHALLARLPFPVYLTINPSRVLEDAIRRTPRREGVRSGACHWYSPDAMPGIPESQPATPLSPLVYHLFGRLENDYRAVLTQDDFFKYLLHAGRLSSRVVASTDESANLQPFYPDPVLERIKTTSLLFLGFRLEDWSFRILFRTLFFMGGLRPGSQLKHVAVQIDPEGSSFSNPVQARQYLHDHFQRDYQIDIYWGSLQDFLEQLAENKP